MTRLPDCYKAETPSSCQDLKCLGHKLNGFYSIKSANGIKLETVYCDFTQSSTPSIPIQENNL